jgi:hypothetical protein
MFKQGETSKIRRSKQVIRRRSVVTALFWIVLAATTAMAQQSIGTVTETVTTRRDRDLNGRQTVSEEVVTHRARTKDEERVVIETYEPSIEGGRRAVTQRVNRVTTVTGDGSQTVEETAERNPAASSEPLRVVQRSVTTVRRSGADSQVSERQVFERDVNGRFVLVRTQIEHISPD